jgi:ABC-type proline/glycine betaine transport system substrate-binding protein
LILSAAANVPQNSRFAAATTVDQSCCDERGPPPTENSPFAAAAAAAAAATAAAAAAAAIAHRLYPADNDYVPGRVTFRDNEWMVITLTIEVGMEMIGMDVMVMETIIVDVVIMVATITVDEKTAVVEDVDNILKPLMAPEHADNILKLPTRTKAGTYNIL